MVNLSNLRGNLSGYYKATNNTTKTQKLEAATADATKALKEMDTNKDGVVSQDELAKDLSKTDNFKGSQYKATLKMAELAAKTIDKDNNGISEDELMSYLVYEDSTQKITGDKFRNSNVGNIDGKVDDFGRYVALRNLNFTREADTTDTANSNLKDIQDDMQTFIAQKGIKMTYSNHAKTSTATPAKTEVPIDYHNYGANTGFTNYKNIKSDLAKSEALMKDVDTNKDGTLSKTEAAPDYLFDFNQDKKLDASEKTYQSNYFNNMDINKDGKIDKKENLALAWHQDARDSIDAGAFKLDGKITDEAVDKVNRQLLNNVKGLDQVLSLYLGQIDTNMAKLAEDEANVIKLALANPTTEQYAKKIITYNQAIAKLEAQINSGKLTSTEKSQAQSNISMMERHKTIFLNELERFQSKQ